MASNKMHQCYWCGRIHDSGEWDDEGGFTQRHADELERRTGHPPSGKYQGQGKLPPHGELYHGATNDEAAHIGQDICPSCRAGVDKAVRERKP